MGFCSIVKTYCRVDKDILWEWKWMREYPITLSPFMEKIQIVE